MAKLGVGVKVKVISVCEGEGFSNYLEAEGVIVATGHPFTYHGVAWDWMVDFGRPMHPDSEILPASQAVFFSHQLTPITPPNHKEWADEQVKKITTPNKEIILAELAEVWGV